MNKRFIWILIRAIVLAGGVLAGVLLLRSRLMHNEFDPYRMVQMPGSQLTIGGEIIHVSLADTPAEREQGLSGNTGLSNDEGMLFIFDAPERPSFWMKDMLFPLDIIWISSDWQVVDITPNLTPETYPATVSPSQEVQYVLEVPAGFAHDHHIVIGQSATFQK